MGRGGSSGGRVSAGDRSRVERGRGGKFRLRSSGSSTTRRTERVFDTRREAELEARNRRIESSRSGVRQRARATADAIRARFSRRSGD